MMKLSAAFFEAVEHEAALLWDREVAAELAELYPAHFSALGAKEETVAALALGAQFLHDPRFAALIEGSLAPLDVPQDRRLHLLRNDVELWVMAADDGKGLDARGADLVERVRSAVPPVQGASEREAVTAMLHGLAPRASVALLPIHAAFLVPVLPQADGYGLHEPQRRLAYAGGVLLNGVCWFDDPLMVNTRAAVEWASGPADLCDRLGGSP